MELNFMMKNVDDDIAAYKKANKTSSQVTTPLPTNNSSLMVISANKVLLISEHLSDDKLASLSSDTESDSDSELDGYSSYFRRRPFNRDDTDSSFTTLKSASFFKVSDMQNGEGLGSLKSHGKATEEGTETDEDISDFDSEIGLFFESDDDLDK